MDYYVKAVGILILVFAVAAFARPAVVKSIIDFSKIGRRIYVGGVVRVVLGVLLIASYSSVAIPWIPAAVGSVMALSGVMIFALGAQKTHVLMEWVYSRPENTVRTIVLIPAIFAVGLIISV